MMGGVIKFYTLLDSLVSWWPGVGRKSTLGKKNIYILQTISSASLAQVIGLHKMLHEDGFDMGFPY